MARKKVFITYCDQNNKKWKIQRSLCFMLKKVFPLALKCVKMFELGESSFFTSKTRICFGILREGNIFYMYKKPQRQ